MHHISDGHAAFTELCVTANVKVTPMDESILEYLLESGYNTSTIPAKTFDGQDSDVKTAGITTVLMATEELDEEVAYRMVKAIYENEEALARGHAGFADFNKEKANDPASIGNIPFHPGAERYYQEIGL